ncbi:hypothetical protein MTBSS4_100127 [Magnetospirillum sp. SS-4]|nr:hypothetical protein MTBSS4_100127 [Magnetospirillum sp. SS-4]
MGRFRSGVRRADPGLGTRHPRRGDRGHPGPGGGGPSRSAAAGLRPRHGDGGAAVADVVARRGHQAGGHGHRRGLPHLQRPAGRGPLGGGGADRGLILPAKQPLYLWSRFARLSSVSLPDRSERPWARRLLAARNWRQSGNGPARSSPCPKPIP